jgi:hypothetical protein
VLEKLMTNRFLAVLTALGLLSIALPVASHHAVQAEFDFDRPVKLTGTLRKVEWINPHAHFLLDVKDEGGTIRTWSFETLGPGGLRRAGLSKAGLFTVGETYTITGYASRNGKEIGFMKDITFADGKVITVWFGDANAN